jgi:hypothetical protein
MCEFYNQDMSGWKVINKMTEIAINPQIIIKLIRRPNLIFLFKAMITISEIE